MDTSSSAVPGFEAHGFETPIEQDFAFSAWRPTMFAGPRIVSHDAVPANEATPLSASTSIRRTRRTPSTRPAC